MLEKFFIDYFFLTKVLLVGSEALFLSLLFFKKFDDKKILKLTRAVFFSGLVLVILRVFFLYWQQFKLWQGSYFLPPYQPLNYFLRYSWLHFGKLPVFDIFLGVFFFFLLWLGTKISRGRFFYGEEKYSGGLAILMNSWPVNLLVFVLTFFAGVLFSLANFILKKNQGVFLLNFRYFWPVIGLLLLILGRFLVGFLGLDFLAV